MVEKEPSGVKPMFIEPIRKMWEELYGYPIEWSETMSHFEGKLGKQHLLRIQAFFQNLFYEEVEGCQNINNEIDKDDLF